MVDRPETLVAGTLHDHANPPLASFQPRRSIRIITRTNAVKRATRVAYANDEKTAAVLAASMRLLERQFSSAADGQEDEGRRYPFFQWLSRRKIAEEVAAVNPDLDPEAADNAIDTTVRMMGYRWKSHDSYIQDFLSYAISARHWSLHIALSDDAKKVLLDGLREGDFPAAVHEVAFEDLIIPIEEPDTQRMQLLAAVLAEREPELKEILRTEYGWVDRSWTDLYETLFNERGWKLRPGLSFQDVNLMLSTAAEGMAIRGLVDQQGIVDAKRKSLLGTLAPAVMVACVDPGDGLTLEDTCRMFTTSEKPNGPVDGDGSGT